MIEHGAPDRRGSGADHGAESPPGRPEAQSRRGQPEVARTLDAPGDGGEAVISAHQLVKVFEEEDGRELVVLDGVEIAVRPREIVAIIGASGAGKSTLLYLLGLLDRPTSGGVRLEGRSVAGLTSEALADTRNRRLGFVFQFHHLLREFTAHENVMMPLLIAGTDAAEASDRARDLLSQMGLWERHSHRPNQLSGGERQRVAVARALANQPSVILADEPSGNLDWHTSEQLHDLFVAVCDTHDTALVIATHNRSLAERADRILELKDGRLQPA